MTLHSSKQIVCKRKHKFITNHNTWWNPIDENNNVQSINKLSISIIATIMIILCHQPTNIIRSNPMRTAANFIKKSYATRISHHVHETIHHEKDFCRNMKHHINHLTHHHIISLTLVNQRQEAWRMPCVITKNNKC